MATKLPATVESENAVLRLIYDLRCLTVEQVELAQGWSNRWARQIIKGLAEKQYVQPVFYGRKEEGTRDRVYFLTAKGCNKAAELKGLPPNVYDEKTRHVKVRNRYRPSDQALSPMAIPHALLVNTLLLTVVRGVGEPFEWRLGREFRGFQSPQPDAVAETATTTYYMEADANTERPHRLRRKVQQYMDRLAKVVAEEADPRQHVLVLMCPKRPLQRMYNLQRWLIEKGALPPRVDVWIGTHDDMAATLARAIRAEMVGQGPSAGDVIGAKLHAAGHDAYFVPVQGVPSGVTALKIGSGPMIYIAPAHGSFTRYFWVAGLVREHVQLGRDMNIVLVVSSADEARVIRHAIADIDTIRPAFVLQRALDEDEQELRCWRLKSGDRLENVALWEGGQ